MKSHKAMYVMLDIGKKNAEINNSSVAMECIGYQLQDGDGGVKDDVEAFTWFKKSADLGNSDSQSCTI